MNSARGQISAVPSDQLKKWVLEGCSLSEMLRRAGVHAQPTHYFNVLRDRLSAEGYDLDAIRTAGRKRQGFAQHSFVGRPLSYYLVQGKRCSIGSLKIRLIREGLLANRCAVCTQGTVWNGRPLMLAIDHINGDSSDNRLENLRLVCPNCHSQTPTFAGRKLRQKRIAEIDPNYRRRPRPLQRKVKVRPSLERLLEMVNEQGYCAVGRIYGVSDNAVRKWLKVKTAR